MSFQQVIYAHECSHNECDKIHLSQTEDTPKGVECASPDHYGTYEYTGGTQAYQKVGSSEGEVCDECGQVKMDSFTAEEISALTELLDQISNVALHEDYIATLIEYQGEQVVVTKPENVKDCISKVLDGTDLEICSDEEGENQQ
jgi:hypothetical protein